VLNFAVSIVAVILVALVALVPLFLVLYAGEVVLNAVQIGRASRFFLVALKSLRRNLLRTSLTYLASFVLVVVVVMVWSVLYFLDLLTSPKTRNVKLIVTEKYQGFSQMPFSYADPVSEGAADKGRPGDVRPDENMTWQYVFATVDAAKNTSENGMLLIALEPRKMLTIMENVFDEFTPGESQQKREGRRQEEELIQGVVKEMERNRKAIILGRKKMTALNKKVGERINVTSSNFTSIELELDIVGVFPPGRYDELGVMNRDYLNGAIDAYPRTHGGQKHPLADRNLNVVWLQVQDLVAYGRIAEQLDASGLFVNPAIKCETLSSGVNTVLEGYKDLFWAMRWLLAPAILFTMVLVIANAISISVRERRTEMAVLKVLGFRPVQILMLVLGEAVLIGAVSGLLSALFTWLVVNHLPHSQSFQVWVPDSALWWGPAVGGLAALAGSFVPAWTACKVRVSEVFARTA
jgi:putative ABC transport system permease protein